MKYQKRYIEIIKEIFHADWQHGFKILYFTIFLCSSLIAYYNFSKGFVMSSDSGQFSRWADDLIRLEFNLYLYYSQNTFINPNYIYSIPIILIAILKKFWGVEWQNAYIAINLFLVFFSLIFFSKSLLILKVRPVIISIGILILTLSVDLLVWPRYVLTDTIFSFLIILSVHLIIKSIVKKKVNYYYILLVITLIFLTRPSSIPFISVIIFFIIISKFQIKFSYKLISLIFISLCIITPFILAMFHQLMEVYLIDNPRASFLIGMVKKGMIIHDRPDTWIDSPKSFIDIAHLYFVRFLFFFSPYASSFSIIHIVINLLHTLIILFSIFVWLIVGERNNNVNKVIALILLITFSAATFHSFTLIDYDWRYRFPVIMPLLILFPLSFEIFLRKIYLINSKY